MAHRHKVHHKAGGHVEQRVAHDAEEAREAGIKRGGKAKHHKKDGGKVVGRAAGGRLDKRARGGGVGSDKHPFSSAFKSDMEHVRSGHKHGGHAHHHRGK